MRDGDELRALLGRIDGRGYKAYRDLRGGWDLGSCELHVDRVQGDPFAAPTRVRLRVSSGAAGFDPALARGSVRRIALEDFLARAVRDRVAGGARGRGSGRSGLVAIDAGGQEVLERSAVVVAAGFVEARLAVGLPAAGRRVLGREAERLLCDELPRVAREALRADALDAAALTGFVECVEDQEHLRGQLEGRGLVAFVADGSVLPRESGASDRPLREGAVPFRAPEGLRVALTLPPRQGAPAREVSGLGVPAGITLVVGGGYHGKSTLLRALERSVHPHVPGDGREGVVCRADAVKIRAEDGRRVEACDISAFIDALPYGRSTTDFRSDDASGSTSQAANIVEALEAGATALLLDEDTSATNFMVRDARMQALVRADHEPITPFLDRVRELHDAAGVSTVLVMGGCGDYLDVADTVIEMRDYLPHDATADARRIAAEQPSARRRETRGPLHRAKSRVPRAESLDPARGRRAVRIDARSRELLEYGTERIDLRAVEQILDPSQTRAIGYALELARTRLLDGTATVAEVLDALGALLDEHGLDVLDPEHARGPRHPGDLARPRRHEIAAALGRLRSVRMDQR